MIEAVDVRTFGDEQVPQAAPVETRFHARARMLSRHGFVTACVPISVVLTLALNSHCIAPLVAEQQRG